MSKNGNRLPKVPRAIFDRILLLLLITFCASSWAAVPFRSAHALVVDDDTGEVLLEKDSTIPVPIASVTKLMTAVVVLDARQPRDEVIRIERADLTSLGRSAFGVPAGSNLTRRSLLELALMSSDNHAAMALARAYP